MRKKAKVFLVLSFLFSTLMLCLMAQASLDDKSLVLYLSFDEGKGNKAEDGSQYGHDGELVKNPKWVGGKFGKHWSLMETRRLTSKFQSQMPCS